MLREPCEHGRYDEHRGHWGTVFFCPGGRTLTDAEALTLLLTEECGNPECESGFVHDGFDGLHNKSKECPSCGGSGRTLRKGVDKSDLAQRVFIPASMLEGGESE